MRAKVTHFIFIFCFVLASCAKKQNPPLTEQQVRMTEEALIGANRLMLQKDKEKIRKYTDSLHLDLTEGQSGLWFRIDKKGSGPMAVKGDIVSLSYKVSLLDGTPCYSSETSGPKQFKVGQGGVESGLEEGILMLRKGDHAIFVMPPHLAAGFPGDGDKIPPRSIVVYNVEVLNIERL